MPRFDYPPTRATWGARCGKSARRVLRGGTGTSDLVASLVPTHHNLDKSWLVQFVEHRVADPRVLRLIQKWLKAGVMEEGEWSNTKTGSPQGSVISPLLANIYLHYGAPGQTWCFQRVKFPPRQEVQPPHRESSLGSEEITNRTKRRQSDERAVTKVKRLSLVKYLTAGRQHRSGWKAPVGTPQMAGRCHSAKSDSLIVLRARESRVHGEAAKQMKTDFRETSPAPTEAGV